MFALKGFIMFIIYTEGFGSLPETKYHSSSSCFGLITQTQNASLNAMTAMCPNNEVIAIIDATTSFQLKMGNCSSSSILANFAECCQNTTDCEFHHSLTLTQTSPDLGTINEQCNGRQRCTVQPVSVTNSRAQCNETIFEVTGTSSHYMHLNHYCIENSRILTGCHGTKTSSLPGDIVYLQSTGFPGFASTNRDCSCSVENDDCTSGIVVYTIQRTLGDRNSTCDDEQYIQLATSNDTILDTKLCNKNTVNLEELNITENFINFAFVNKLGYSAGNYWLGFKSSSNNGNITLQCPGGSPEFCTVSSSLLSTMSTVISPSTTISTESSLLPSAMSSQIESTSLAMSLTVTSVEPTSTIAISSSNTVFNQFPQTQSQTKSEDWKIILVGVFGAMFLLAVLVLIFVILCIRKGKDKGEKEETSAVEKDEALITPEKASKATGTVQFTSSSKQTATETTVVEDKCVSTKVNTESRGTFIKKGDLPETEPDVDLADGASSQIAIHLQDFVTPNIPPDSTLALVGLQTYLNTVNKQPTTCDAECQTDKFTIQVDNNKHNRTKKHRVSRPNRVEPSPAVPTDHQVIPRPATIDNITNNCDKEVLETQVNDKAPIANDEADKNVETTTNQVDPSLPMQEDSNIVTAVHIGFIDHRKREKKRRRNKRNTSEETIVALKNIDASTTIVKQEIVGEGSSICSEDRVAKVNGEIRRKRHYKLLRSLSNGFYETEVDEGKCRKKMLMCFRSQTTSTKEKTLDQ